MPHSSILTGIPPRLVTVSTRKSASVSFTSAPIWSMGLQTPVDVSACTTATMSYVAPSSFALTASTSTAVPHSNSSVSTSALSRVATSCIRIPNTPLINTSNLSSGSTRFTKQVSMPAEPVPEMGIVTSFSVWNICFSIALISSMIPINAGSRCPIVAVVKAS